MFTTAEAGWSHHWSHTHVLTLRWERAILCCCSHVLIARRSRVLCVCAALLQPLLFSIQLPSHLQLLYVAGMIMLLATVQAPRHSSAPGQMPNPVAPPLQPAFVAQPAAHVPAQRPLAASSPSPPAAAPSGATGQGVAPPAVHSHAATSCVMRMISGQPQRLVLTSGCLHAYTGILQLGRNCQVKY